MALNIKDESVHQQIKQITMLTGESQAEAVRNAVAERLRRLQGKDRRQRLLEISRDAAARIPPGTDLSDHVLYDDRGLPT